MNPFQARYGPWALVTGASRGLGAEFAWTFGQRTGVLWTINSDAGAAEEKDEQKVFSIISDLVAAGVLVSAGDGYRFSQEALREAFAELQHLGHAERAARVGRTAAPQFSRLQQLHRLRRRIVQQAIYDN